MIKELLTLLNLRKELLTLLNLRDDLYDLLGENKRESFFENLTGKSPYPTISVSRGHQHDIQMEELTEK